MRLGEWSNSRQICGSDIYSFSERIGYLVSSGADETDTFNCVCIVVRLIVGVISLVLRPNICVLVIYGCTDM